MILLIYFLGVLINVIIAIGFIIRERNKHHDTTIHDLLMYFSGILFSWITLIVLIILVIMAIINGLYEEYRDYVVIKGK